MMQTDTPRRYHPALVTMHWLMVVLIFVNLYLGIVLFEPHGGQINFQAINAFLPLHMLTGLTIIILVVARFILRHRSRRPAEATAGNKFIDLLAKIIHYGLYLTILVTTILGLTFSLQSGRFQSAFLGAKNQFGAPPGGLPAGRGLAGTPPAGGATTPGFQRGNGAPGGPGGPGRPGGPGGFFGLLTLHLWSAFLLLGLISLHILAFLYHQFIRKDNLISRMWYGRRV